jgi:hypothetical protein
MASTASRVTVSTTATLLTATNDAYSRLWVDGYASGIAIRVPVGGATVSIGFDSSVTTSTGWDVLAGESISLALREGDTVYGIVASSTQAVQVIRTDI